MLLLLFQIEAKGTLNGEKVEHQRTTFVKQLKLGKVSPPCSWLASLWRDPVSRSWDFLALSVPPLPTAPSVPVHPPAATELVQPRHAPEAARARAV
jgi:hypothetical protein